jgi:hypothetical protein
VSEKKPYEMKRILLYGVVGLLIAGIIYHTIVTRSLEYDLRNLRNQVALRDETIEVEKGVFQKRIMEMELEATDLKNLLSNEANQVQSLVRRLEQEKQTVLAVTQMSVYWKQKYEFAIKDATQEPVPDPVDPTRPPRLRVKFDATQGSLRASGWTLTDPPEAYVQIEQVKPLKLVVAFSRRTDGQWTASAASSDENIVVDIEVGAVDLRVTKKKWYEPIELHADIPITGGSPSVGMSYELGDFSVGPTVHYDGEIGYGIGLGWRPFAR